MANKEALKFQEALANKIKTWEQTEDFAAGTSNRQKLNRSLNLLLGSDPEVIVDMLGGDFVPDDPRDAMNLIRGLDLKTLKSMEILSLKGLGDKLVGHHEIAANTLGEPLRFMKPTERLDVYKGLTDMGQRYGMDPKQILLIADSVHKSIAHSGDFSGKKTGVLLPYIVNETGTDFLKRFEASIGRQLDMASKAVNAPITQNYYQAINAAEAQLGLPKGSLISPETPLTLKSAATNLLKPVADPLRKIAKSGENIIERATDVVQQGQYSTRSVNTFMEAVQKNGVVKMVRKPLAFGAAVTGLGIIGDIGSVKAAVTTPRTDDMAQTERDISGLGGVAGLAALVPAAAPVALPMSLGFAGASAGIGFRRQREEEQEKTRRIMDPEYRVSIPEESVITRTKPRLPTSFTGRL